MCEFEKNMGKYAYGIEHVLYKISIQTHTQYFDRFAFYGKGFFRPGPNSNLFVNVLMGFWKPQSRVNFLNVSAYLKIEPSTFRSDRSG